MPIARLLALAAAAGCSISMCGGDEEEGRMGEMRRGSSSGCLPRVNRGRDVEARTLGPTVTIRFQFIVPPRYEMMDSFGDSLHSPAGDPRRFVT